MEHNFKNENCKYPELQCPYHACLNTSECTFVNVRSNGGNFGEKVCFVHENNLGNWIEITRENQPPKDVDLLVKNRFGEIYEFKFWNHCNVEWSAIVMGIQYFKIAR